MTDITDRLRRLYAQNGTDYVQEAADTIERLRSASTFRQARTPCWRAWLTWRRSSASTASQ